MSFNNLLKRIANTEDFDVQRNTLEILQENSELIADMVAQQLALGKDGNDEDVLINGSGYKPSTIYQKKNFGSGLGAVTDRVTNYSSGAFYQSLILETKGSLFFVESPLPYFGDIIGRSGQIIMELNSEHKEILSNIVRTKLKERWIRFVGIQR